MLILVQDWHDRRAIKIRILSFYLLGCLRILESSKQCERSSDNKHQPSCRAAFNPSMLRLLNGKRWPIMFLRSKA